jgi:hypothetical protein
MKTSVFKTLALELSKLVLLALCLLGLGVFPACRDALAPPSVRMRQVVDPNASGSPGPSGSPDPGPSTPYTPPAEINGCINGLFGPLCKNDLVVWTENRQLYTEIKAWSLNNQLSTITAVDVNKQEITINNNYTKPYTEFIPGAPNHTDQCIRNLAGKVFCVGSAAIGGYDGFGNAFPVGFVVAVAPTNGTMIIYYVNPTKPDVDYRPLSGDRGFYGYVSAEEATLAPPMTILVGRCVKGANGDICVGGQVTVKGLGSAIVTSVSTDPSNPRASVKLGTGYNNGFVSTTDGLYMPVDVLTPK